MRLRRRLTRASISSTSPGHWPAVAHSIPTNKGILSPFSGFDRIRIAPTCATHSVRIVGVRAGGCRHDGRGSSLIETFLMPTIRLSSSSSVMRSTSRNGCIGAEESVEWRAGRAAASKDP